MIFLYIYINFILEYNIGEKLEQVWYTFIKLSSRDTWQFVYEIVAIRDEYLWHSILTAASSFILKS